MRYAGCAVLATLVAASACAPASETPEPAATMEQDMAAIAQVRDAYASAWKAGDAAGIADLYTDDAAVLPGNQPTATGHAGIMQYNEGFFTQFTPDNITLTPEETHVQGDWAFDRGTYEVMATPKAGGDTVHEMGRYFVLLERQADGSWKVMRDIDNTPAPLPVSPPPPPE